MFYLNVMFYCLQRRRRSKGILGIKISHNQKELQFLKLLKRVGSVDIVKYYSYLLLIQMYIVL